MLVDYNDPANRFDDKANKKEADAHRKSQRAIISDLGTKKMKMMEKDLPLMKKLIEKDEKSGSKVRKLFFS